MQHFIENYKDKVLGNIEDIHNKSDNTVVLHKAKTINIFHSTSGISIDPVIEKTQSVIKNNNLNQIIKLEDFQEGTNKQVLNVLGNKFEVKDDQVVLDKVINEQNNNKQQQLQDNSKNILVVTHTGFIMEFIKDLRLRKGLNLKASNDAKNGSITIIKIYCMTCGGVCSKQANKQCELEYDFIVYNDISHLQN